MEIYCFAKPFLPFLLHPPSPFLHHKLAKKPVHKLSNLNLTQLPSGTQQLIVFCQLLPLFVPFFSPPVKTGVSVPVEKGSPDSALMTLFMDKKKCHFQWDSSNFPGILQGPNGNLWRERNYLPFAASCFLWRSISPALIRMTRIFFLLACRYCIPLPGYSSRKWHCFQWELPKEGPKRCLCPQLWSIFWYSSCFVIHLACDPSLSLPQCFRGHSTASPCWESTGMSTGSRWFCWWRLKLLLRYFV